MNSLHEHLRSGLSDELEHVVASWPDARSRVHARSQLISRQRARRRRLAQIGAAVVLIGSTGAGLRLAGARHDGSGPTQVSVVDSPPVAPYLPTFVPAGLTLRKATQFVNPTEGPKQLESYRIYRQSGSPVGSATISLSWTPGNDQQKGAPAGLQGDGTQRFVVRDGNSVLINGRGVDTAALDAAAESLTFDGSDYALTALPAGWSLAFSTDDRSAMVAGGLDTMYATDAGSDGPRIGISIRPEAPGYVETIAPTETAFPTPPVRGNAAILLGCDARKTDCGTGASSETLVWEESPGVFVLLSGTGVPDADLRRVAESLQPLSDDQWLTVVNQGSRPVITTPAPDTLAVPRHALANPAAGWTKVHADSVTTPGTVPQPSTLRWTAYRSTGRGPLDPYLIVVTGSSDGYTTGDNGVVRSKGQHRAIGWTADKRFLEVRSYGVPEADLRTVAEQVHASEPATPLPDTIGSWTKVGTEDGSRPTRYDSISYEATGASIEFHNKTGDFVIALDNRLDETGQAEAIDVAGQSAVLVNADEPTGARFWVLWPSPDGVVEIDVTGVPRDQLSSALAGIAEIDAASYADLVAR